MRSTAFIAGISMILSFSVLARAAEETPPRTINTNGESVVYVVPDEVILGFGVETFNANLDTSKSANEAASQQLVASVKDAGVEMRNIQTDSMSIEIRYRDGGIASGIEGYVARRSYAVTIKDVKKIQAIIDVALKNGANQLEGVEYKTTELRKHRDLARKMAIKAAKEKAEALASELDCRIGSPRTINEGYAGWGYGGGYWGRSYGRMSQNSQVQQSAPGGEGGGDENAASPLGQIGVHAQVTVAFDLIPGAPAAAAKPEAPAK